MQRLFLLLIVWTICASRPAAGATCPAMPDAASRTAFLEAERSPPSGHAARERLRDVLGDYPLFPYLELARLRANLSRVATTEIETFLERHDGEPVTFRLEKRWLRQLAGRRQWDKFLEWYPGGDSVDLQCLHARALLETGNESAALDEAGRLWMAGKSRPKACDPVFEVWLESDRFSPSLAWERFGLAMDGGNPRLARYLERFLGPTDRRLATTWRTVHKRPHVVGTVKLEGEPSRVEAIFVHGLVRLARRDPAAAVEALARVEARFDLGPEARAAVARRIGLSFASRHEPQAIDWLWQVDPAYADDHVLRWRAAAAVLHSQWERVLEAIESMPGEEPERERWRYWRARALEATGVADQAREEFESLAQERDYYGFLAADRVDSEYRFNHSPLEIAPAVMKRVAAMPGTQRALEFLTLDRRISARREWHALIGGLGEDELQAASWIAGCRDWHGRAILTIARTSERDDLELRFPVVYRDIVESASSRRGLSPAAVYALIRQESAFMADARSSAGALGLMQIMPQTGRMLMRKAGRKLRRKNQLLSASLNVDLGTRYIQSLLSKWGGSPVLATASYNAGPHRVRSWLPEKGEVEAAAWIDNIPFTETRRYVRRYLAYSTIYQHRLGRQPIRVSKRMPLVRARAGR